MTRRAAFLVAIALGALVGGAPLSGLPQQPGKVFRIGILSPAERPDTKVFDAFREGLRDLGYVDGQNITIEYRLTAGDLGRLPAMAADLVRVPVDIIVTDGGATVVQIAHEATQTIPIVAATSDPVTAGVAASWAHPGGNVTGFLLQPPELGGKRLQFLKEVFPAISRVAALWNPSAGVMLALSATEAAARTLGVQLRPVDIGSPDAIAAGFEAATADGAEGFVVLPDAMFWNERARFVALAAQHRSPAIYPEREYADDGGLLAYGANVPDNFRRAAEYVDKILKGARPGDLPIQQPVKFEFVVNWKTAGTLGLTIPPAILARADEVIE